jgi:transporter family protein
MWVLLAFVSALCLGFYDISKKIALRENAVVDVLTASVLISSGILVVPLLLSRLTPETMQPTLLYVPRLDLQAHLLTVLKSVIVLSSWVFGYISLKHLPISVVNPWQATRPMWTLIGALLIFGERLNSWQWLGITLAIGSILVFSFANHKSQISNHKSAICNRYYIALALTILIGACSGLYDKFMMRHYDHNAVQVYYTFYQAVMMFIVWVIHHHKHSTLNTQHSTIKNIGAIILISVFLIISDNVYMLALRDPDSLIAVVSTIRRGGAVIGFAYGLIFLREPDPWKKILAMSGVLAGLVCLALGTIH